MPELTADNRASVLADVQLQPYATQFTAEQIDQALASAFCIYSGFEHVFVPGFSCIKLRSKGAHRSLHFAVELIPALLFGHRFFGDALPAGLTQKLKNQSQTHDTLFELMCLGAFQPFHEVHYEPTLATGKVPDLMLVLRNGQSDYVECKSQGFADSDHQKQFSNKSCRVHEMLESGAAGLLADASAAGLRVEVRLFDPAASTPRRVRQTVNMILSGDPTVRIFSICCTSSPLKNGMLMLPPLLRSSHFL